MELETLTVVMAVLGITLLYGAVTNRNPLDVIQKALRGEDISSAAPISTASAGISVQPSALLGGLNAAGAPLTAVQSAEDAARAAIGLPPIDRIEEARRNALRLFGGAAGGAEAAVLDARDKARDQAILERLRQDGIGDGPGTLTQNL